MSKLIGIMGLKNSGKDSVAKKIIYAEGGAWKKVAFADALKDAVAALFGWNRQLLEGDTPEGREWREKVDSYWERELGIKDFSPRKALQMIGTNVMRNHFDEAFWIKALKRKILDSTNRIIVTDVRFPNEANMIKSMGGNIVQVIRGELPEWWNDIAEMNKNHRPCIDSNDNYGWIDKEGKVWSIHPSECSLAGVIEPDYVIHNDGTLSDLQKEVIVMLNKLY